VHVRRPVPSLVIPAKAGIHLLLMLFLEATTTTSWIKMDPGLTSFAVESRRDDERRRKYNQNNRWWPQTMLAPLSKKERRDCVEPRGSFSLNELLGATLPT
jgi:hypothetical protein